MKNLLDRGLQASCKVKREWTICFLVVAWGLLLTGEANGAPAGYTIVGANNYIYAPPGQISGGYFVVDDVSRPPGYYSNGSAQWVIDRSGGAFDDDLYDAQKVPPQYAQGASARTFADGGSGISQSDFRFGANTAYANGLSVKADTPLRTILDNIDLVSSGVPLTSRYSSILNPVVLPFTAEAVFQNPATKAAFVPTIVDGQTIESRFSPHLTIGSAHVPLKLRDLAILFEVDHFNWRQTVTLPAVWSVHSQLSPHAISQPYIDPIPSALDNYVVVNQFGVELPISNQGFDTKPFYFNENTGSEIDVQAPSVTSLDGFTLHFDDAPSSPAFFNPTLLDMSFRTELVGVKSDGTSKPTGMYFTWKSNTRTDSILGGISEPSVFNLSRVTDLPADVQFLDGGVSVVEVVTPEPTGFVLAALASLGLLCFRRRLHRPGLFR